MVSANFAAVPTAFTKPDRPELRVPLPANTEA